MIYNQCRDCHAYLVQTISDHVCNNCGVVKEPVYETEQEQEYNPMRNKAPKKHLVPAKVINSECRIPPEIIGRYLIMKTAQDFSLKGLGHIHTFQRNYGTEYRLYWSVNGKQHHRCIGKNYLCPLAQELLEIQNNKGDASKKHIE